MTVIVGGILLAVGVVLFILEPVFSGQRAPLFDGDEEYDEAVARRRIALTALRDLEYDRATGKVDGDDYEVLKAELSREALRHLEAQEDLAAEVGRPAGTEGAQPGLEEEIARIRAALQEGLGLRGMRHGEPPGIDLLQRLRGPSPGEGSGGSGTLILEARGVVCHFGATTALNQVDLASEGGTITALLGGNGAGKSTLLRVLTGERPPDSGSVTLDGAPVSGRDREWRARIGLVSHRTGLYRNLTVLENLRFFARVHGLDEGRDRILEAAGRVGVAQLAEALVGSLSRGQRQRVALVRTLLHEPEVLLLDEPFTGLDPAGGRAVSEILEQTRERGRIVVLVTHDVPRGLAMSDRTVVLQRGRKVLDEPSSSCTVEGVNEFFGVEAPVPA